VSLLGQRNRRRRRKIQAQQLSFQSGPEWETYMHTISVEIDSNALRAGCSMTSRGRSTPITHLGISPSAFGEHEVGEFVAR
jgi:hypothetical protein